VHRNLLPTSTASVTERGILFEGLYYYNKLADEENWFSTARTEGRSKVQVSYDPRQVDVIYLHGDRSGKMTPCFLTERSETFADWSWEEYRLYIHDKKLGDAKASPRELQNRANTDAQIGAIVNDAKDRKKAALADNPKSKSALLANQAANRTEERLLENRLFRNGDTNAVVEAHSLIEAQDNLESDPDFTPVERPRNFEMFRKKHEERLNKPNNHSPSEEDNV
jgi:hypothetical protein